MSGARSSRSGHRDPAAAGMLAGLAWCALVAVVGGAVWHQPSLTSLLVVAPLFTAVFAGVARTAVVGSVAVGVALFLGWPDHNFGSAGFLIRLFLMVLGSAVAVGAAYLRVHQADRLRASEDQAERERRLRLAAETSNRLALLGSSLAGATEGPALAAATLPTVRDQLGATGVALWAWRDRPSAERPADVQAGRGQVHWGDGPDLRRPAAHVAAGGHAVFAGSLAVLGTRWPEAAAALEAARQRSVALLPLGPHGGWYGSLAVVFDGDRVFDETDVGFLRSVAAHVGRAAAGLYDARREGEEGARLADLAALGTQLAAAATPGEIAQAAVRCCREVLGATSAVVRVPAGPGHSRALWGEGDTVPATAAPVPSGGTPAGRVLAEGATLVLADQRAVASALSPAVAATHDPAGGPLVAVPLPGGQAPVGVLEVAFAPEHTLGPGVVAFLERAAAQVGPALERAGAYEAEREAGRNADREHQRLALLADVTRLLVSSLDPEAVVERLVDLVAPRFADACVVLLPGEHGLRRAVVRGDGELVDERVAVRLATEGEVPLDADLPPAVAFRTGQPVVREITDDLGRRAAEAGVPGPVLGPVTALSVPLPGRGKVIGVMTFIAGPARGWFSPEEVTLATDVAARAGAALDNANRFQHEHDMSETLQRAVLPEHLAPVPGLELSAEYRAGTAGTYAGGDWYDAVVLDGGAMFFSVGDVMGKGTAAAALMGQVRSALRAYAVIDTSPASVLERVDRLFDTLGEDRLVTAVAGIVAPDTGETVLAVAGHPAPVVVGADGTVEPVGGGPSLLLGAGPVRAGVDRRPEHHLTLEEGATLVLYSDGLVERRGESLDTGLARLARAAGALRPGPEAPMSSAATRLVEALAPRTRATDDVVVLTIHRPRPAVAAGAPGGLRRRRAASARQDPPAPPHDPRRPTLTLPPEITSTPAARHWLKARLEDLPAEVTESAALLVSELVTNAVLHAGTEIEVSVQRLVDRVRVEVADRSPVLPTRRDYGSEAATGRGLTLFELLPSDWGAEPRPGGKVVWFELPVDVPLDFPGPGGGLDLGLAGPTRAARPPDPGAAAPPLPPGELFTLALLGSPIALMQRSSGQYEALYREFRLIIEQDESQLASVPRRLLGLIDELGTTFSGFGGDGERQWRQALARGDEQVDLRVSLPTAIGPYCVRYDGLLDEADEYCRTLALLTLPADPECTAVRKWFFWEMARQAEGAAPTPWVDSEFCRGLALSGG